MSDVFELAVSVDLRDELSEQELAELHWHLGIGPQPERLSIVTEFPFVVVDEAGEPVVEDEPRPLLVEAVARPGGWVVCSARHWSAERICRGTAGR